MVVSGHFSTLSKQSDNFLHVSCTYPLLVEDDPDRIARFTAWCPPDARLVVARGGGRALGLLERDPGRVYAGLLLDHDLPG